MYILFARLKESTGMVFTRKDDKCGAFIKVPEMYMGYNALDISDYKMIHIPPETPCVYLGWIAVVH